MSVFVSVEKKSFARDKKWLRIIYKAEKALIALLLTKNSKKQRELKSEVNPHPYWSISQMMCVCLYVRTFKIFDISCSLSKRWLSPLQVPSLGKRFSWLFRVNENRCLSTIELHCDGLCTLYSPFRLTFAPHSSYYQFVMHAGNKWGISNSQTLSGGAPSLLSCISAPIWPLIVLAQLLRAQLFCQQCASERRHYSLLCTIFSICQTDNSCQLPKLTMTHVWPSFEYSFTHAKYKDENAKEERK